MAQSWHDAGLAGCRTAAASHRFLIANRIQVGGFMLKFCKMLVSIAIAALLPSVAPALAEEGVTSDTILIGAYGPLTGPASALGLGARAGMALAVKEVNDSGGINGRKLQVIFEDDGFSPAKALAAVKKLVEQDHVFMIFGLSGSNPTVGTLDYVKDLKIPNYFSIASAPPITHPFNRYFFRGTANESSRYGELYSEFFTQALQLKRVAILSGVDENGKNEGDNLVKYLKKWYGIDPVARAEFKIGDKDFTPQILQAKAADPEIIALTTAAPEASIIIRQARELGLKQPFFGGGSTTDNVVIANDGYAAEGFMAPWSVPLFPDSQHPDMVKFREAWSKLNPNAPKGRPNLFDLWAYGDTYCVAEGLKRAGPDLTREKFIDALETLNNYQVSQVASPRTFTNWNHIGSAEARIFVVLGQHWIPLAWEPQRESEIFDDLKPH
jgi:branched-chain amino acid transport system substrate-binding protein